MNIHSKIPHGLLRSGRARSPACPVLGLKGLGYVPIVGTCADLDGGDRSLAFFAAAAHPPRSESWHLSPVAPVPLVLWETERTSGSRIEPVLDDESTYRAGFQCRVVGHQRGLVLDRGTRDHQIK